MGIRKELMLKDEEEIDRGEEIMVGKVRYGKSIIVPRVVGVYVNGDMEGKLEGMRDWMEG